jgi:hypothetical protein
MYVCMNVCMYVCTLRPAVMNKKTLDARKEKKIEKITSDAYNDDDDDDDDDNDDDDDDDDNK